MKEKHENTIIVLTKQNNNAFYKNLFTALCIIHLKFLQIKENNTGCLVSLIDGHDI